jgi:hypothetical protein
MLLLYVLLLLGGAPVAQMERDGVMPTQGWNVCNPKRVSNLGLGTLS